MVEEEIREKEEYLAKEKTKFLNFEFFIP